MARVNRVTLPPVLGTAENQQQEERGEDTPPREGLLQLLKYPTMVVRMLIIVFNWYWQSSQRNRQTDRQTGRRTDTETEKVVETDRQTDKQTDRQTGRKTGRQTDSERQSDRRRK